ncbi:MAG: AMP-binding protein, partial [Planctomycetia bacterium]
MSTAVISFSGTATASPAAGSLVALMLERLEASADGPALCDALDGGRTWTWSEVIAAAAELADFFLGAGIQRGDRLAHVGPHSTDWIVVDLACQLAGLVHVPLHAEASAAEHARQLAWLGPRGVVRTGPASGSGGGTAAGSIGLDLRFGSQPRRQPWADGVLRSECWRPRHADLDSLRDTIARHVASCDPDACSAILLSSGTTGRAKGVMQSQRAVLTNATAAADVFLDEPHDVRLAWLPMSHSLARTGDLVTALVRGGCLSVVSDRRRVLDACAVLPPTVVLGVPAFFERLAHGAESGRIADLQAALGGRVRVCVSGGAPLRERTVAAFAARGLPLVQGYGLAEAGPVVTLSNPRTARPGTVGPPLAGVELKIDDRPATRGQLLVRTASRAIGVIEDAAGGGVVGVPRQEPRAGSADWLETGDLATIEADGHVRITGRLVDTLVLSGGTKVPPAEVEAALAEDPVVAQVCVLGDGLATPLALVVPEPAILRVELRRMGLRVWSRRAALRHP